MWVQKASILSQSGFRNILLYSIIWLQARSGLDHVVKGLGCIAVEDTYSEYISIVFPRHSNPAGFLYGGYMMNWIIDSSMISIIRATGGEAVLGYIDNIYFLNPVTIGSMIIYRSWLARAGRSSLDVYTEVIGYNPAQYTFMLVATAKAIYVNIDNTGRPSPHGLCLETGEDWARRLVDYMDRWHEKALSVIKRVEEKGFEDKERVLRYSAKTLRRISTEDTMTSEIMYAGRLMLSLDEVASIVAHSYAESSVVTASVDQMIFRSPIRVGDVIEISASLIRTWRTSMEIEVEVRPYRDRGDLKTRSYLTFVKIGDNRSPRELRPYIPVTPEEAEAWAEAEVRRINRMSDLERMSRYRRKPVEYKKGSISPLSLEETSP